MMRLNRRQLLYATPLATGALVLGVNPGNILSKTKAADKKPKPADSMNFDPNLITYDSLAAEVSRLENRDPAEAAKKGEALQKEYLKFITPHVLKIGTETGITNLRSGCEQIESLNGAKTISLRNFSEDFIPKLSKNGSLVIFEAMRKPSSRNDARLLYQGNFPKANYLRIVEPKDDLTFMKTINLEGLAAFPRISIATANEQYRKVIVPGNFKGDLHIEAKGPIELIVLGQNSSQITIPGRITTKGIVTVFGMPQSTVAEINKDLENIENKITGDAMPSAAISENIRTATAEYFDQYGLFSMTLPYSRWNSKENIASNDLSKL